MDKADNRFYREKVAGQQQVMIDYTNHAGVRAVRQIAPISIFFDATEWHPEPQWMLAAYDQGRDAMRFFAVADIHQWSPRPISSVDASIARQLQSSMERNARMRTRLLALYRHPGCPIDVQRALESIDKDEEPAWHA